jgi:Leucine-rich repeat (LRR) protein
MRNKVTALILFTSMLLYPVQSVFAEQTDAKDPSSDQGRIVHFPKDRSMGTLYIQDVNTENWPSLFKQWDWDTKATQSWQYFCPAKGNVIVPRGKRLRLRIKQQDKWKDLSPLQKLSPNDLYSLSLRGELLTITNPDDRCIPHIAHLTGLKELDITSSNISDRGLKVLENFPSLEHLHLPPRISDSGMLSVSRIKSLRGLYLNGIDRVSNKGFEHLKEHPNLETIFFSSNQANAKVMRELTKLPALKHLSIHGPNFTDDALMYLREIHSLKELNLDQTMITDVGLQHLKFLTELESLSLYNTRVTDAGISHLIKLKSLRKLNLQKGPYNKTRDLLTDKSMSYLAQIKTLEYLELDCKNVTDFTLSEFTKLPKLRFLSTTGSVITSLTDAGLRHLSKIQSLEGLYIPAAHITDEGMATLGQLTNLRNLGLSFCPKITDKGLSKIANMKNLNSLSLHVPYKPPSEGTYVTISGFSSLNALINLKELTVNGVAQDGSGLDISRLKNLESLEIELKQNRIKKDGRPNVSYESLTDKDLQCLANLTRLYHLRLSSNEITDKGIMHLKGLTNLENLYISQANLTDQGLAYLKDMKKMEDLRIGGNFTENGLQHLKELKTLESLWLYTDYGIPNRAVRDLKNSLPNLRSFQLKTK